MQQVQMQALPKTVITRLLNDETPLVINDHHRALKAFSYIVKVYYGLNAETVELDVYEAVLKEIKDKFPNLTFEQLNLSYSESVILKRQGVSITKGELVDPVALFWQKTQVVIHEAEKLKRQTDEELTKQQEITRFKQGSMELYHKCLTEKTGWTGTPFQASSFADNFAHRFLKSEKDELWELCKKEAQRQKIEAANSVQGFLTELPVSDKHLFCDNIVRMALERGIQLIVD